MVRAQAEQARDDLGPEARRRTEPRRLRRRRGRAPRRRSGRGRGRGARRAAPSSPEPTGRPACRGGSSRELGDEVAELALRERVVRPEGADASRHQAVRDDEPDLGLGPGAARSGRRSSPGGRQAGDQAGEARRAGADVSRPGHRRIGRRALVSAGDGDRDHAGAVARGARRALAGARATRHEPAGRYGSVWRLAGLLENVDSDGFVPRVSTPRWDRPAAAAAPTARSRALRSTSAPARLPAPRRRSSRRRRRPQRGLRAPRRRPASRS